MKRLPALPALLLAASLSAGCNLSAGQIQQLVDTSKQIVEKLTEAAVKIQVADSQGKAVTLTKADVKQVFLDGKEVSADKYDLVNGEIKFRDLLDKNSGQKSVKIVLKGGTVIDNVKIDTTEGKAMSNEAKFLAGPGGRMTAVDAGKNLADAAKERQAEARKSGVVVKLGIPGLNNQSIEAIGVQGSDPAEGEPVFVLPRSAYTATPEGGVVFDVQFLWVLSESAQASGASESEVKGANWFVVHKTSAGKFVLNQFRFLKGLQQMDPVTGTFPPLQVLDDKGSEFGGPDSLGVYDTFTELTAGVTLVELDEWGRIPENWADHKVGDFEDEPAETGTEVGWDFDPN